jgi:hypothetical protein
LPTRKNIVVCRERQENDYVGKGYIIEKKKKNFIQHMSCEKEKEKCQVSAFSGSYIITKRNICRKK